MKKFILILTLFSSNAFAETMSLCSEDDSYKLVEKTRNAIIAKTYYPYDAQAKKLKGEGSVLVSFDKSWNILNIELLQSTHSEQLDGAMLDIIKTSNYPKPNCSLEEFIELDVPFHFKLP
jgi:TonB family protein